MASAIVCIPPLLTKIAIPIALPVAIFMASAIVRVCPPPDQNCSYSYSYSYG